MISYETITVPVEPDAFNRIAQVNIERSNHFEAGASNFTLGDFGCAMAGEAGELCNIIKKLRRNELGIRMNQPHQAELLRKAEEEIADVYLYLDLIATKLGIDLPAAIVKKFNKTSQEHDAPYYLEVR